MNKRFNINKPILALIVVFAAIIVIVMIFFLYSKTLGENEYCQALRKQKSISSEYGCSVGDMFEKNGIKYIYVYVSADRPNVVDQAIFTMDVSTKKVLSEDWTS